MRPAVVALALVASAAPAMAQPASYTRPTLALTQAGAEAALRSAEQLASQSGDPAAIAVVNTDGRLLAFLSMDGVRPGSADLAIGKARAAALMQRPTEELESNVAGGRVALATSGLTALRGGAPLKVNGVFVGAIGVAGTRKEDDAKTAAAVSASFGETP